jgi:hypothetical protein
MTFRAIIIGLLSAGLLGLATPYADLVIQGSDMVDSHMPLGPITLLMVLVLVVNTALRRVRQQWAFTRQELATIYIMTLASAALPSNDAFERLAPVIAGAFYFPPQGTLQPVLTRYVSPWATIRDPTAIKYFFEGLPEGQPIPWASWVALLISWTTFGMLLYAQYYFVAVLLRRRWVDEERLTFPLAQVPLTILEGERPSVASPLFRNSIFWIGFGGVFVLHSLNGLHYYFGFIPEIKLTAIPIGQSLQNRPWDALKDVQIYVYFSMIGLAYLISGEVAISLWGFYWLYQIQGVVFRAYGMEIGGATGQFNALTFWRGQELGGFVALGAFVLWSARHQLLAGARAFSKRDEAGSHGPGLGGRRGGADDAPGGALVHRRRNAVGHGVSTPDLHPASHAVPGAPDLRRRNCSSGRALHAQRCHQLRCRVEELDPGQPGHHALSTDSVVDQLAVGPAAIVHGQPAHLTGHPSFGAQAHHCHRSGRYRRNRRRLFLPDEARLYSRGPEPRLEYSLPHPQLEHHAPAQRRGNWYPGEQTSPLVRSGWTHRHEHPDTPAAQLSVVAH